MNSGMEEGEGEKGERMGSGNMKWKREWERKIVRKNPDINTEDVRVKEGSKEGRK